MGLRAQVILIGLLGVLVGLGSFATARLVAPLPHPVAAITSSATWIPVAGDAPVVPVPISGALAVEVSDGDTRPAAARDAQAVHPIASVAKTMTAMVVLEQHPLAAGQAGPTLTMTVQDQADYRRIAAAGGSVAPVRAGEVLSERDLLLGLMLPSANNLALTLARWVDGTVARFVDRVNARAAALALAHTHFADPDGLDPATVASAADLVALGRHAISVPGFVDIVSTRHAVLPDGTPIDNLDVLLASTPGWIGIKTGWTPNAGGCLLFAVQRSLAPGTAPVTVVGAVLGQPPDAAGDPAHPELGAAMRAAAAAADAVYAGYTAIRQTAETLPAGGSVRSVGGALLTGVHASGPDRWVVARLGDSLSVHVDVRPLSTPLRSGAPVGAVTVQHAGVAAGSWDLVTDGAVEDPDALARLLHW